MIQRLMAATRSQEKADIEIRREIARPIALDDGVVNETLQQTAARKTTPCKRPS